MFYFILSYNAVMPQKHQHIRTKEWQELKGKLEYSIQKRGKSLLKEMMDWVLENHERYPQWKVVSIDLVCGSHAWADEIADEVEHRMANALVVMDEEL